jgi:hypothetical protein
MNIGKKKIFSSFLILGIVGILLLINGRVTHGAVSNVGFTVSPATPNYMMDFGEVETCVRGENFPVIKDFHITNTSGGDKTITVSTSVSGTGFSCISNCQSFTLASTESSKAITIKFSPSFSKINRAFTGSVTFTAIGGEPISVNLKGNGVCYSNYPIAQPGAPELPDKDCDSRSGPTNTCDPNVSNSGECCYVGSNISDSAGCVPTCDFTNATIKPEPWSKYKLKCVPGEYCGEEIGTKHRCWVVDSKMCSTADKLAFDGKTPTPNPHLRWGDCACGSVGQQYKVCCAISPSVTNATSVTPTNAVKSSFQDPYDPLEGVCGGSTTVVALPDPTSNFGDKYPASCPQVPVFDVFEAKTVTGTQTAVVTWKIKDGTADWCGDANFATNDEIKAAGLTQGTLTKPIPASGSFTIGCKDKYHYVVGNSVLTQAIYKSASATPGGAAFYYCPAPSGTCIPVGGSYASIDKCSTDVGSTCYKTADECATSSACRVVPPQGSRYMYYCKTAGGCQKTSNKYQTVADCQSNLTRYLPGQTTGVCYESENLCRAVCGTYYYCPAPSGACTSVGESYTTLRECKAAVANNPAPANDCYADSACGRNCAGGCSTNCGRCSNDPAKLGVWVNWYDPGGECDSDYNNCRTEIPNDPRCLSGGNYFCKLGSTQCQTPPSGSTCSQYLAANPSIKTYNGCQTQANCKCECPISGEVYPHRECQNQSCVNVNSCGRNQCTAGGSECGSRPCPPIGECTDGLTRPNITLNFTDRSSPRCLPNHSGGTTTRSSTLTWSANIENPCSMIGGGTTNPPSLTISCEDEGPTSWLPCNQSGSGQRSTGELTETTDYGLKCSRGAYTCSNSEPGFEEDANCTTWCSNSNNCGTDCASCTCSSYCALLWKKEDAGSDDYCSTWSRCLVDHTCTRPCTNLNLGTPCTEFYPCPEYEDCKPCVTYECKDTDWTATRTSKKVCAYITTPVETETVRVVQKPKISFFDVRPQGAGSDKPFSSSARILLTKLAEFKLGAKADSSNSATYSFTTKMFCTLGRKIAGTVGSFATIETTGSVQGSGSLTIQNPVFPFTDSAFYPGSEPPLYKTSQYQLYCKNQSWYNNGSEAGSCYDEAQTSGDLKVEPYGTELEPKAGWLKRIRDIFLTTRVNRGLAGGE